MVTNKVIEQDSELYRKAQALIKAAYEYWQAYRDNVGGPAAVVWLDTQDGHFILFTRGEYKEAIMYAANRECMGEVRLFRPFEPPEK